MNSVKGVDSGDPSADSGYPESQQGPTTLHLSPQNTYVTHISLSFTNPHPPFSSFPHLSLALPLYILLLLSTTCSLKPTPTAFCHTT